MAVSDSDEWEGFWIGQQPTLGLRICYVSPTVEPDEGWYYFVAEAVVPGFTAHFKFESQLAEFKHFGQQVRSMHDSLKGTASFCSTEHNVKIDAEIDRLGHVTWNVLLRSQDLGPELRFSIEEDQTLLWNVAAKIEEMLESLKAGKV
jgi:hypothetical protein